MELIADLRHYLLLIQGVLQNRVQLGHLPRRLFRLCIAVENFWSLRLKTLQIRLSSNCLNLMLMV